MESQSENSKNNNRVLLVSLALLALGGLFYWFQIRPSTLRQTCAANVKNEIEKIKEKQKEMERQNPYYDGPSYKTYLEYREDQYANCLAEHGLSR